MDDLDYYSYEIGVRIEFPLENRQAKSQHRRARVQAAQASVDLQSVENIIINEVRQAIRVIETSRRVIDSSSATLMFTNEKLKAEEKKYEVGMSTAFAVLEYQSDLATAESNLAFAYSEHRKSQRLTEMFEGASSGSVVSPCLRQIDNALRSRQNLAALKDNTCPSGNKLNSFRKCDAPDSELPAPTDFKLFELSFPDS